MMDARTKFEDARRDAPTLPGIFCDCFGTLYGIGFDRDAQLVAFLNRRYAAGVPVTLFSADPDDVREKVQQIGLHPRLARSIEPKSRYDGCTLEIVIDDNPPPYIRAEKLWDPRSSAFRDFLSQAARACAAAPPSR